jgi:hypothetical protein
MKDFKARLESLLIQAAECDLITDSATDVEKRHLFARLARDFRQMARDIEKIIAAREQSQISN